MTMGTVELIFKNGQQTTMYGVCKIDIKKPFLVLHQLDDSLKRTRYYQLEDIRTFSVLEMEEN